MQEERRGTPVFGEKRREKERNVRVVGLVVVGDEYKQKQRKKNAEMKPNWSKTAPGRPTMNLYSPHLI